MRWRTVPLGTRGPHLGELGEPQAPSGTQPGTPDVDITDPPTRHITIVTLGGLIYKIPQEPTPTGARHTETKSKKQKDE